MNKSQLNNLIEIVKPIVTELGYELYHLEYVKEDNENFLRIYIDTGSGISLEDCEKVSRKISDELDLVDPISDSYYLEVSSPGIERTLYTDNHLQRYIGEEVFIKLNSLLDGKRNIKGILVGFNESEITINVNNEVFIPRDKISAINLIGDLKGGN